MFYNKDAVVKTVQLAAGRNELNAVVEGPDGHIYVSYGHHIERILLPDMKVELYAGRETAGSVTGHRLQCAFQDTYGLCWTSSGSLLVVENVGQRVQIIDNDTVSTFAGTGQAGYLDGPRLHAQFRNPSEIVELEGVYYLTDYSNSRVRMILPNGQVTTVGNGDEATLDGAFGLCSINHPWGICVGPRHTILVAEYQGHCIRQIHPDTGLVTTYAGGPTSGYQDGEEPRFNGPIGMALGPSGELYVADRHNRRIRMIEANGVVSTVLGAKNASKNGPLNKASTRNHQGMFLTSNGDLYWTEYSTNSLRYIPGFILNMASKLGKREQFASLVSLRVPYPSSQASSSKHASSSSSSRASASNITLDSRHTNNGLAVDFTITHTASGTTFHLHSDVFCVTCPGLNVEANRERIAESLASPDLLEVFFNFFYGEKPPFTGDGKKQSLSNVIQKAQLLHLFGLVTKDWSVLDWGLLFFDSGLTDLSISKTVKLLVELAKTSTHCDAVVERCITHLRKDQARFARKKSLLKPVASEYGQKGLYTMVTESVESDTEFPEMEVPKSFVEAYKDISTMAAKLAETVKWVSSKDPLPLTAPKPTWKLTIQGNPDEVLLVHSWMLYPRWKFFQTLVDAGLSETELLTVEMPSLWSKESLLTLIRYIYTGIISDPASLSIETVRFFLSADTEQFYLRDNGKPLLIFEKLIGSCASIAFPALTTKNCLSELVSRTELGLASAIQGALKYTVRHLDELSQDPEQYAAMKALPDSVIRDLFFTRYQPFQNARAAAQSRSSKEDNLLDAL